MEDVVNIGLIGPGRVAKRLASAINNLENVQLWSICGRSIEQARSFANQHSLINPANVYSDIEEMLNDEQLNAVIIATPDHHHTIPIIKSLQKGKHVFVEKPVCTSISDARKILNVWESGQQLKLAVGYHLRWHQGLRYLSSKMKENAFGEIFHINLQWAHTFIDEAAWRRSGRESRWWCLSVLGTHCVDIIKWIFTPVLGDIVDINLTTTNQHFNSTDESSLFSIKFETGATAAIYNSILFNLPFKLAVHTSQGYLEANDLIAKERQKIVFNDCELKYDHGDNLYEAELNDFITAIYEGREPEVGLFEGISNIKLLGA